MKKKLSMLTFILVMLSAKIFAQSNLTWVITDKYEKGYFKDKLEIKSAFSGFTNAAEASGFFDKLKNQPAIASIEPLGKDVKGNYLVSFKVKEPHVAKYYVSMFSRMGVTNVIVNGETKTAQEILAKENNKKENTH
jgi:hypothetical protein